jgi:hypothetical protein
VESRSAQLAVMAQDCDQPDYSKLVQALCSEANVSLITVPASKTLGEWCGLCKLDAEGLARKVVGCSFVVIKVRAPGSDRGSAARAALGCAAQGRRSRVALAPAGLRGGVRGPGRGAGVPEVQVSEACHLDAPHSSRRLQRALSTSRSAYNRVQLSLLRGNKREPLSLL